MKLTFLSILPSTLGVTSVDLPAQGTHRRTHRIVSARAGLLLGSGLLTVLAPTAGAAQDTDSLADLQEWLANRYPPGALVEVVTSNLGNVFDCVDRAHQPALRRGDGSFKPIASRPAAPENGTQPKLSAGKGEALARLETISCPSGSVPMAHIDLQTLLRFGSLSAFFAKHPGSSAELGASQRTGSTDTHQYAKVDQYVANWGGDALLNLWNPYTERDSEFSLSQIWVVRGDLSDKQTLESGWQDYPDLYNSDSPKLFVYSTQDGYGNTGCYNGTCGDFVQYSASITPTIGWTNHSTVGGTQQIIQLRWQRDDTNDNWWLMYGTQWVGYYPGSLFDSAGVKNEAERVSYGGEIVNDDPVNHTSTDMGSGGYPAAAGRRRPTRARCAPSARPTSGRRRAPPRSSAPTATATTSTCRTRPEPGPTTSTSAARATASTACSRPSAHGRTRASIRGACTSDGRGTTGSGTTGSGLYF